MHQSVKNPSVVESWMPVVSFLVLWQILSMRGGILLAGLPRLCERGYSLTPVDISQSDHNPAEEKRTPRVNWNGSFVPLSGTEKWPPLFSAKKCQRFPYGRVLCPPKQRALKW